MHPHYPLQLQVGDCLTPNSFVFSLPSVGPNQACLTSAGPGEPLATAAGVLGLMALWRCFYTIFLDFYNSRHWATGAPLDRHQVIFIEQVLALLLCLARA